MLAELRAIFATKKSDLFIRCVTEKMLTYALGRGLEYYDKRPVDKIIERLDGNDDHRFIWLWVSWKACLLI